MNKYQQAKLGIGMMCAGVLLGSPFLLCFGMFEYLTAPMTRSSINVSATLANAVLGLMVGLLISSALMLFSPLFLYGTVGLYHLGSAINRTFNHNKTMTNLFNGYFNLPNNTPTSTKIVKGIIGVLWSPFWALGGLLGLGTKALVNAFNPSSSSNTTTAALGYPAIQKDSAPVTQQKKPIPTVQCGLDLDKTAQSGTTFFKAPTTEQKPSNDSGQTALRA